jgi:hypothetical protein
MKTLVAIHIIIQLQSKQNTNIMSKSKHNMSDVSMKSQMVRLLLRFGGDRIWGIKDFRNHDLQHYMEKAGLEYNRFYTVDCWNVGRVKIKARV